eukprot:4235685-Pleurochrysis_carterae.AAC.1
MYTQRDDKPTHTHALKRGLSPSPRTLLYASTALLTPKTDDPAQQQSQAILKFLPLMIGWFSLNVPSGLGLYWLTNNFLTTASTLWIRNGVAPLDLAGAGGGGATVAAEPPKPQGFGRRYGE